MIQRTNARHSPVRFVTGLVARSAADPWHPSALGERVTAEGHWVQDKEFGLQFRAEMLNRTAPTTKEGIEKYLGSGMVKGIGPI